jgi:replicative DNA helicase
VHDAAQTIRTWPLDIMDIADLTIGQLRSQVKRLQLERQGRLRLIVIDYLQLLNPTRSDMSEYEKVSEISRTLKIIAKECHLPVVALSQLSRESEKGTKPGEPRLSHLRGSGSIEQDADAVIFLHNEEEGERSSERKMKVIIAKNRFGPQASVQMMFYAARQRFVQVRSDEGPQQERVGSAAELIQRATASGDDEDMFA